MKRPVLGDPVLSDDLIDKIAASLAPAELATQQRDRLLARILARREQTTSAGTRTVLGSGKEWLQIAPFIEARTLHVDERLGIHTSIMRMRPGGVVPAHRHSKAEEFIVLEGECHIGTRALVAGDVHLSEAGSWHGPVTTHEGVLVLLRGEYPYPEPCESPPARG